MILYEFEGKKLLKDAGIKVPEGQLLTSPDETVNIQPPLVLKAQVLSGKRADVGGIIKVEDSSNLNSELQTLFAKTINGEKVEKVLAEKLITIDREYYLSITYDTETRGPLLSISEQGGTGIEERKVDVYRLNPLNPIENLPKTIDSDILEKIIKLFFDADCLLLEINPLVKSGQDWIALDAKIKLDDDSRSRHPDWDFPSRGVPGRAPTKNEIEAKKIDQGDYRGVAGSTYFDLDGDIAIMASGGGISLTGMDALLKFGAKPSNFTEYSGNPPKEKVTRLTKIVLDKPNIHGLWVIGTVAANFTDIYETLSGLIEGLREAEKELGKKFDFPIVIRRGGPNEKKAFEMLREVKDFNLTLQGEETSLTESAKIITKLSEDYKQRKEGMDNSVD